MITSSVSGRLCQAVRAAARTARAGVRELCTDTRGGAAVLAAIMFPVVIGGIGLGTEAGYWLLTKRKLQQTADVSVHAAGVRKRAGDTKAEMEAAALNVAREAGYEPGTMMLNDPPVSGAFAGDEDSVALKLEETHPRLFSSIFTDEPITITARAVARLTGGSTGCVLALSKTAPGAVTVTGSTSVDLEGCDVASNSNALDSFAMSGNSAAISAGCVYTVGESVATSNLSLTSCDTVQEYAAEVRDPYKDVEQPAVVGSCQNRNVGSPNSTTSLTPMENHPSGVKSMRFCNGLDIKGKVNFGSGLYIIEGGDFTVNGGDVTSSDLAQLESSGVTFYLAADAELSIAGNALLTLSAPSSGPFAGLLFFGSRSATGVTNQISGNSGSTFHGAIYSPASHIEFHGNSKSSGGCTQVIGRTVTFTGNSNLQSSCPSAGTREIITNRQVRVVE